MTSAEHVAKAQDLRRELTYAHITRWPREATKDLEARIAWHDLHVGAYAAERCSETKDFRKAYGSLMAANSTDDLLGVGSVNSLQLSEDERKFLDALYIDKWDTCGHRERRGASKWAS